MGALVGAQFVPKIVVLQWEKIDFLKGYFLSFFIKHCFNCHPSDSTVGGCWDGTQYCCYFGILTIRVANHSARSHP
jgi:hypothetical protein